MPPSCSIVHRVGRRIAVAATVAIAITVSGAEMSAPPAQIAVSPSRLEVEIGPRPSTEALSVINLGDEPVAIEVTTATWELDESNRVRILEPDEQSLDQWMVVNPLRFTIPPRESQTVRFSIRSKVEPTPGEHRAMLYFNQVLPDAGERRLRVKFRLGVAIYGMAGEITRVGELHAVEVDDGANPVRASFDISSAGNAHVRLDGQYAIYRAVDYPGPESTTVFEGLGRSDFEAPGAVIVAGSLPTRPVLAGSRRRIVLHAGGAPLAPGDYVLDLNGRLADRAIDRAVPFTVAGPTLQAETTAE